MKLSDFFPGLALKRAQQRVALDQLENSFDAAKPSQWRKDPVQSQSGQAAVEAGGTKLRAWARHLDENHDLAIGVLDVLVGNIVNVGLTVTPTVKRKNGNPIKTINDQISELWLDWSEHPEVTGQWAFPEVQRLACRAWLRDGEQLVQHLAGIVPGLDHLTQVPYSIEMIEADLLPFDLIQGENIVSGIQVDAWGRPVFYHLLKTHPGNMTGYLSANALLQETRAVPADLIEHVKFVRRFGQIRGQSALHGVLTRLDDVKDFEESERIAARVAAAFTGYLQKSADMQTQNYNADGDRTFEMMPGMIFDNLLPGESVGTIEANRPNTNLEQYRLAMLRAVASGTGASYSSVSKDYSGTYSSQRQELVESQPSFKRLREYFISSFLKPVYRRFIQTAVISGQLRAPAGIDLTSAEFGGVSMPWIDPQKEAVAAKTLLEANLRSRHGLIKEAGYDPLLIDEQIENDPLKPEPVVEEPTEKPDEQEDKPEDDEEEAAA